MSELYTLLAVIYCLDPKISKRVAMQIGNFNKYFGFTPSNNFAQTILPELLKTLKFLKYEINDYLAKIFIRRL